MAASSSTDPPDQNVVTPLFGETFTDVGQDYSLGKRLGSGNFAKVVLGELKRAQPQWKLKAGDAVAIKVVKKPSSRKAIERVQMLKAEVEILRSIHHPNIVRLFEVRVAGGHARAEPSPPTLTFSTPADGVARAAALPGD